MLIARELLRDDHEAVMGHRLAPGCGQKWSLDGPGEEYYHDAIIALCAPYFRASAAIVNCPRAGLSPPPQPFEMT